MKRTYRYDPERGGLVEVTNDPARANSGPFIQSDYTPYACPITGQTISGRAAHRENLKRHNCVDGRDFPRMKRGE